MDWVIGGLSTTVILTAPKDTLNFSSYSYLCLGFQLAKRADFPVFVVAFPLLFHLCPSPPFSFALYGLLISFILSLSGSRPAGRFSSSSRIHSVWPQTLTSCVLGQVTQCLPQFPCLLNVDNNTYFLMLV